MKHMGRPATAREAEKVNAEVQGILADSVQADALLAVGHPLSIFPFLQYSRVS